MAYFDCIVGGSGKGNTVTVTCAEEFAGLTITLAKTGKTYTKTCPSTSPYVVTFNGVENGTYTVSCTVDGETYSETVIVQDISCVLDYGFNWRTWVDIASQLDSSDYDTLDEVLADEKALRELFLEHACVDYMASVAASNEDLETVINDDYCAKWINLSDYALDFLHANEVIADLMDEADKYFYGEWVITDSTTTPPTWGPKGNVPVMTANNAPYGTASARTQYNNDYGAWRAFDGGENSETLYWSSTSGSVTNQWLSYKFVNPINVKRLFILSNISNNDNKIPKDCKLQYSNDGNNWNDVATFTNPQTTVRNYQDTPNNVYALYWRVLFINNYGDSQYMYVREIQFYGRELKVSVPKMTSNTAPYGEAFADSESSASYAAWKAFNGDNDTYAAGTSKLEHYWGYVFPSDVKVKMAMIYSSSIPVDHMYIESADSKNGEFSGEEFTVTASANYKYFITLSEVQANKAIRFRAKKSTNFAGAINMQFYGLDYSEKEFEAGTTKKWLYDHGVELETLDYGTAHIEPSLIWMEHTSSSVYTDEVCNNDPIDLSSYSLLRCRTSGKSAWNSISGAASVLYVSLQKHVYYTSWIGYNVINPPLTDINNLYYDVSSINQSAYVAITTANGNDGIGRRFDFEELWLE